MEAALKPGSGLSLGEASESPPAGEATLEFGFSMASSDQERFQRQHQATDTTQIIFRNQHNENMRIGGVLRRAATECLRFVFFRQLGAQRRTWLMPAMGSAAFVPQW